MNNQLIRNYFFRIAAVTAVAGGTVAILNINHYRYGPTPECRALVDSEREEWQKWCERRNKPVKKEISDLIFESLKKIEQKRVEKTLAHQCSPDLERWHCVIDHQTETYRALFYDQLGKQP